MDGLKDILLRTLTITSGAEGRTYDADPLHAELPVRAFGAGGTSEIVGFGGQDF